MLRFCVRPSQLQLCKQSLVLSSVPRKRENLASQRLRVQSRSSHSSVPNAIEKRDERERSRDNRQQELQQYRWWLAVVLGGVLFVFAERNRKAAAKEPVEHVHPWESKVIKTFEGELADLSLGPNGETSLYQFSAVDIDGRKVDFTRYEGKVCVVVNIAEGTAYSNAHFIQLQDLYERYKNQGLVILAFPCYDVASRSKPLPEKELKQLLRNKYGITFPIFRAIQGANPGPNANPVFYFCRHQLPGARWYGSWNIPWDFTKFVFDHTGKGAARYDTGRTPYEMEATIVRLLEQRQEDLALQKRLQKSGADSQSSLSSSEVV